MIMNASTTKTRGFKEEVESRFIKQVEAFHENNKHQSAPQRTATLGATAASSRHGYSRAKPGELDEIATKASVRRITPPEPQRSQRLQQPQIPSQSPRLLPQPLLMSQLSMSISATAATSTAAALPFAASPVSAPTYITVIGWSTATSFCTFHDRNVKLPIVRRC